MSASLRASFCSLGLLAALSACSGSPPRYPITDPQMALRAVRDRDARVQRFRAHGSADHFGAQGRIRGEVFVFVSRPSLRVDTRAFGNTVSSIVSNGRTFAMADFQHGAFYTGEARPCVAAQLLGVPLEAGEVVALLAGGPPLLEGDARIRWDDDHYVVDIAGADGRAEAVEMTITDSEHDTAQPAQQHPRPTRAELRDRQGVRAVLTFEDYTDLAGTPFPRRVRVVMERDNVDLMVRYSDVALDPELPDDAFSTEPPSEALQTQTVTCDAPATANAANTNTAPATR